MADPIVSVINKLRDDNIRQQEQSKAADDQRLGELRLISQVLSENLKMTKQGLLDAEEGRRESAKKGGGGTGTGTPSAKSPVEPDDFDLSGTLAILGGIGASVAGFAVGLVQGFNGILKLVTGRFLAPFRAIAEVFEKRGTSKFLKADSYKALGKTTKFFRNLADTFARLEKSTKNILKPVGNLFKTIRSYAGMIGNSIKGISGVGIDKITKPFKDFGKFLGSIQKAVVGLPSPKEGSAIAGLIDKVTKPFKNLMAGIKGIAEGSSRIGKTLGSFFSAFKVIGRFVAFPLTIIMGIIDGFKGLLAGADRQSGMVNKLIGGAIGAITGVLKGLVAVPLDMLKSAVSWIAGKLGFTEFEKLLDSFSFADAFQKVGDAIADGFIKFFDGLRYVFSNFVDGLMKPFEGGFSFGGLAEFIFTLPNKIMFGLFDLVKNGVSALLSIFGATDAAGAVDDFSFIDTFEGMIDWVKSLPSKLIDAMLGLFEGFDIAASLNGLGDFATLATQKLKSMLISLLPEPDSLAAAIVPDALYEWANLTPAEPPAPSSDPAVSAAAEAPIASAPAEPPSTYTGSMRDAKTAAIMDAESASFFAEIDSEKGRKEIEDKAAERNKRMEQMEVQANEALLAKEQRYRDAIASGKLSGDRLLQAQGALEKIDTIKAERPLSTQRTANGQELQDKSRENAQAAGGATNVVVSAPQSNQTSVNNSTSAIMDTNLPTSNNQEYSWAAI